MKSATQAIPATSERPNPRAVAAVIEALAAQFGNRLVTSLAVRQQHAHTATWLENQPADAVVFAQSTADVQAIVRLCARHGVPIIAYGTGTSLEGHLNAPFGGITVDLKDMNRVLDVHAGDLDCVVEPGVTRKQLNEHLRDQGLFFPIDPGADASLGGMAATRASGTNAVRYGTMKDNVLALTAVLANGEIMHSARRAKKTSAGYDLTRLLIGSEGTLGIITELTLKLHGIPEAISGGVCPFPSVEAACNAYSKLTLPKSPVLFLEFHGSEASVAEQSDRFGEIAAEYGGGPFEWATKAEDRSRLWQARHDAYWAAFTLRPGARTFATDVCVPISRLAECVTETQKDIAASGLICPILGHVGDGNFHCAPLIDMENPAEIKAAEAFMNRLVERALAMEGTSTGEHGIGQGKMKYLEAEYGSAALEAMRAIKRALDPHNVMNPGTIVALG